MAYRVLNKTLVRAGVEAESAKVGPVEQGEILLSLAVATNSAGAQRVQFDRGWVSVVASNGAVILEPLEGMDLSAKRLASPTVAPPAVDSFHGADWSGGFADRWRSYSVTVSRAESGAGALKELVSFLDKRASMEEQAASSLRSCLGDSLVSSTLSAAKGSALGWLSGATGGDSPRKGSAGAMPAESAFAMEPFESLRASLLSTVAADSMRRAREHIAQAQALRALHQQLEAFAAKHNERKAGVVTAAGQRLRKLDEAFVAVKRAEADYDRYRAQAVQSEQEFLRNMEDEKMAQTPMMQKLSTQVNELKAKRDQAQQDFKANLEKAIKAEAGVYDRDLPHVLADFRDMEAKRLSVMADTLAKYTAALEPAASNAATMHAVLQSAVAPVDAGFDLDSLSSVSVVPPTAGVVPAGYLSLPKQLTDRLAELDGSEATETPAARNQATCPQPVVAVAALPASPDGLPHAVSALCARIADASTATEALEPVSGCGTGDGWTAVADLYANLSATKLDGVPNDALVGAASPAAALACLQRLLRSLDAPLITAATASQLVQSFGKQSSKEQGDPAAAAAAGAAAPSVDAFIDSLPSGAASQVFVAVLKMCTTVVQRSRQSGVPLSPEAMAMVLGPALLATTASSHPEVAAPSALVSALATVIEQQAGPPTVKPASSKFAPPGAAPAAPAPAPPPAPASPSVPVAVVADDSEREARVAAEARAAEAERSVETATAEIERHREALARTEFQRDAQLAEVERLSKALAAAEESAGAAQASGGGEEERVASAVAVVRDELTAAIDRAQSEAAQQEEASAKAYADLKAKHADELASVRATAMAATEQAAAAAAAANSSNSDQAAAAQAEAEAARLAASRAMEIEQLTNELRSLKEEHADKSAALLAEQQRYSELESQHKDAAKQLEGLREARAQAAEAAAGKAEVDALKAQLEKMRSDSKVQLESAQNSHAEALERLQAAHAQRVAEYEADTAQLLADAEEKSVADASASKRKLSAALAAQAEAVEQLRAEQAAHAALKAESGELLEGVQSQMGGAVTQLTGQVKELSAKLGTTSKQLADADKERKLYVEAVRMLKLRLGDSEAKVKDFAAKRMLYENEIERLSEWVAEHTIAGAKVSSELESVPQAAVEKWLTQLETSRHKVQSWRDRLKEECAEDSTSPAAQAALKRMLEEVRQAMRAEVSAVALSCSVLNCSAAVICTSAHNWIARHIDIADCVRFAGRASKRYGPAAAGVAVRKYLAAAAGLRHGRRSRQTTRAGVAAPSDQANRRCSSTIARRLATPGNANCGVHFIVSVPPVPPISST